MEFITLDPKNAFTEAIQHADTATKLVVCGDAEDVARLRDNMEFSEQSPEQIIAASRAIDVADWFKQKKVEVLDDFGIDASDVEGEWPGELNEKPGFTLATEILTGKPVAGLMGAQVDAEFCWQIPAFFKYGGWNDCPNPEIHCAIWKYWEEQYGAKIVGLSGDVIEATVFNPPKSQQQAMELAWQQYTYCYDIVAQGVETVANLAATLLHHHNWYFWWD